MRHTNQPEIRDKNNKAMRNTPVRFHFHRGICSNLNKMNKAHERCTDNIWNRFEFGEFCSKPFLIESRINRRKLCEDSISNRKSKYHCTILKVFVHLEWFDLVSIKSFCKVYFRTPSECEPFSITKCANYQSKAFEFVCEYFKMEICRHNPLQ